VGGPEIEAALHMSQKVDVPGPPGSVASTAYGLLHRWYDVVDIEPTYRSVLSTYASSEFCESAAYALQYGQPIAVLAVRSITGILTDP